MHFVYILRSKVDDKFYVGMTQNLKERVAVHNAGRVRPTKARRPFELIYAESYATRQEARAREKFLKSYAGSKTKKSIVESLYGPIV